MNQSNLISIVVPMYNVEKYIGITIESILNQTYKNLELILVDDGSKDNTVYEAQKYKDARIHIIYEENHGAPVARNLGRRMAKGEYLLFFDADDQMAPNHLQSLLNGMLKTNADLAIGNHNIIDKDGNFIGNARFIKEIQIFDTSNLKDLNMLIQLSPFPDTKLLRTSIIVENDIDFADVKQAQDLNFYLKYLACCQSVWITDEIVCYYRILNNSISHKMNLDTIFDIKRSVDNAEEFYKENAVSENYRVALTNARFYHYVSQARRWYDIPSRKQKTALLKFFYPKIKLLEKECEQYFSKDFHTSLRRLDKVWKWQWLYFSHFYKVYDEFQTERRRMKNGIDKKSDE